MTTFALSCSLTQRSNNGIITISCSPSHRGVHTVVLTYSGKSSSLAASSSSSSVSEPVMLMWMLLASSMAGTGAMLGRFCRLWMLRPLGRLSWFRLLFCRPRLCSVMRVCWSSRATVPATCTARKSAGCCWFKHIFFFRQRPLLAPSVRGPQMV